MPAARGDRSPRAMFKYLGFNGVDPNGWEAAFAAFLEAYRWPEVTATDGS